MATVFLMLPAGRATVIITTDTTYNGGTLSVIPNAELVVSGPDVPVLTLTNGADTAGVEAVVVGTTESPYGSSGWLIIKDGSTLTNSGSGLLATYGDSHIFGGSSYLGLNSGSTGTATVTGSGSTWTHSGQLHVGRSGTGTLSIENGGQVSNTSGHIASNGGSTGTVTVTGAGSTWTHAAQLIVSTNGTGTLNIENGGLVSNTNGYLGQGSNSFGTATVTGTGSTWANSGVLHVRNGMLTVEDGGEVIADGLHAAVSDLAGDGIIRAKGALLDGVDLVFDGASGTSQVVDFGNGGEMLLNIDGSGDLGAGYKGVGMLTIRDGVTVASNGGLLGSLSGSTGTAMVTGGGSTWTHTGELTVGRSGNGILKVEDGGQVSSDYGYLGYLSGTGTATVTGAGSTWTHTYTLTVGQSGTGILNIEDGGLVGNTTGYLGLNRNSTGTATVTGSGSIWTQSGELHVGSSGTGTLNVEAGGQVSSARSFIGHLSNSTGTATVTGSGSTWTNAGQLTVGQYGTGTLTVENGGEVITGSLYAAISDLAGDGIIHAKGAVLDGVDLVFDGATGTAPVVGFGSGGELLLDVDGMGDLGAGYKGTGTLTVSDGVAISSLNGRLGSLSGSTGTATVTGSGSTWTNAGQLTVGQYGTGTLTVENGGEVITGSLYAAISDLAGDGIIRAKGAVLDGVDLVFDSATGTAPVVGFGSGGELLLDVDGTGVMGAGHKGTGTLTIRDGVVINSISGRLGYYAGSNGMATVTGMGSTWAHAGQLIVGFLGAGTLKVEGGGQVSNTDGNLGQSPNVNATATVTGGGSIWTNTGMLFVNNATLKVEDGGQVSNTNGYLGRSPRTTGIATVTGSGSTWTNSGVLYVGWFGTGELTVEDGGQVNSAHGILRNYSYRDPIGLPGTSTATATATAAVTGSGSTWTTGMLFLQSGTLTISNGGSVIVGDTLTVDADSTLTGSGGTLVGDLNNAGTLAVGGSDSPGVMTIDGDLINSGTLKFKIAGLQAGTEHDVLDVTGAVHLGGMLEVELLNDFIPQLGDTFNLFNFGQDEVTFAAELILPELAEGLAWDHRQLATTGTISVVRTSLEAWRHQYFSESELADENISGLFAAPAGDAVANLLKFAFGLDPMETVGNELPRPVSVDDGGVHRLGLELFLDPDAEVEFTLEISTDLKQWDETLSTLETIGILPDNRAHLRLIPQNPLDDDAIYFLRLRVELME